MTTVANRASLPPTIKRFDNPDWAARRILITVIAFGVMVGLMFWSLGQDYAPVTPSETIDVAIILAPLLAAAAAVERLLEVIFDFIETQAVVQIVALMAKTERWIGKAEAMANRARDELVELNLKLNPTEKASGQLQALEDQVKHAEALLANVTTQAPVYRQAKRMMTLYLSFLLGLLVASFGNLQVLHLLGILKPDHAWLANVDVLLTGIIIATGSGPVHSAINILQQGQEALASTSHYLETRKERPSEKADKSSPA
jgi:hypothetical protein